MRLLRALLAAGAMLLCCKEPQPAPPPSEHHTMSGQEKSAPRRLRCEEREGADRALCLARRCFDKGARTYSAALPAVGGKHYQAGDWQAAPAADGAIRVTLPIRAPADRPRDASWEISVGSTLRLTALDENAAAISREHNACR